MLLPVVLLVVRDPETLADQAHEIVSRPGSLSRELTNAGLVQLVAGQLRALSDDVDDDLRGVLNLALPLRQARVVQLGGEKTAGLLSAFAK